MLTLLVGGVRHPAADHRDLPITPPDPQDRRYREVRLQVPLEQLPDAWETLRRLRDWIEPGGVLSVVYGEDADTPFATHVVTNLLHLARFEPFLDEGTDAGRVARARPVSPRSLPLSSSIIVPCKNEVGNVDDVVRRVPDIGQSTEILFVDGASTDGTRERVETLIRHNPDRAIRLLRQDGPGGKAAAVFQGFDHASGDILIILDADLTVAPEVLPRFYLALAEGMADFANGTRFAYPMQAGAMRPLNKLGNRAFSYFFSWLLETPVTDSLCGTKAIFKRDWPHIKDAFPLFGGHDRWGDFDLLLGAAHAGLRIIDVPARYYTRTAGESKMRPIQDGVALARTCLAGIDSLKLRRGARNR